MRLVDAEQTQTIMNNKSSVPISNFENNQAQGIDDG